MLCYSENVNILLDCHVHVLLEDTKRGYMYILKQYCVPSAILHNCASLKHDNNQRPPYLCNN